MIDLESALTTLWNNVVNFIPGFVAAIITLVIGFIIGKVIGRVVKEALVRANVDKFISKQEHLNLEISSIFSVLIRWVIYVVFIQQAAMFLGVAAITTFVTSVLQFLPGLIAAAVVIIIGYVLAVYLKDQIITSKTMYSDIIGKVVFFLLVYISIAMALPFVGINTALINNILLIIIASVGIGIAIALGLGLKDVISETAKDYAKRFKKR